jgi:putative endonuclease
VVSGPDHDPRDAAGWRRLRALLRRVLGSRGERAAARYLRGQGLRVLARNVRAGGGELDLIARDGDTLVFVEVKTRRGGDPAEAVTPAKQATLTRAALAFLKRHRLLEQRCRFDVVAIVWDDARPGRPRIQHLRDAFPARGRNSFFS